MNIKFPSFITSNPVVSAIVFIGLIAVTVIAIRIFDKKDWF